MSGEWVVANSFEKLFSPCSSIFYFIFIFLPFHILILVSFQKLWNYIFTLADYVHIYRYGHFNLTSAILLLKS